MRKHSFRMDSMPLTRETLRACDCVLIVANHSRVDYELIGKEAKLIVDTRNAMAGVKVLGLLVPA